MKRVMTFTVQCREKVWDWKGTNLQYMIWNSFRIHKYIHFILCWDYIPLQCTALLLWQVDQIELNRCNLDELKAGFEFEVPFVLSCYFINFVSFHQKESDGLRIRVRAAAEPYCTFWVQCTVLRTANCKGSKLTWQRDIKLMSVRQWWRWWLAFESVNFAY